MFHFLKQPLVLTPETIVLAFDAIQLDRGMTQLGLGVPTGLGRGFQVFDVLRG